MSNPEHAAEAEGGHATMDHSKMGHSSMDHSKMDHSKMDHSSADPTGRSEPDHSAMDHSAMGHSGHGGDHVAGFRRLFWVMLVLTVPVVGFSPMFGHLVGYMLPNLPWILWISPVLGTVMYVWGGRPFLTGAVSELRARKPGMMLLIGLAITVAFVASSGASLGILAAELDFWWELALLITIMLLGHWIEMRSLAQTS